MKSKQISCSLRFLVTITLTGKTAADLFGFHVETTGYSSSLIIFFGDDIVNDDDHEKLVKMQIRLWNKIGHTVGPRT